MNSLKKQIDMTLKDELPRLVGAKYTTGAEQIYSSRRNSEAEPKWKQCPAVDVLVMEVKSDAVKNNTA